MTLPKQVACPGTAGGAQEGRRRDGDARCGPAATAALCTAVADAAAALLSNVDMAANVRAAELREKKAEQEALARDLTATLRRLKAHYSSKDIVACLKSKLFRHLMAEEEGARALAAAVVRDGDPNVPVFTRCGRAAATERWLLALRHSRFAVRAAIMRTGLAAASQLLLPVTVSAVNAAPVPADPVAAVLAQCAGAPPPPRKRPNFPKHVVAVLKRHFAEDKYPGQEAKAGIAAEANIDVDQVSTWFINARGRAK